MAVTPVPLAAAYRSGVAQRPYVLLSAAMSADGDIGDAGGHGRELSDAADWDRVDELRSLAPSGVLLALRFSAIGNEEM
jgi:hypothetical protein